jgi:hypothetical protein
MGWNTGAITGTGAAVCTRGMGASIVLGGATGATTGASGCMGANGAGF